MISIKISIKISRKLGEQKSLHYSKESNPQVIVDLNLAPSQGIAQRTDLQPFVEE